MSARGWWVAGRVAAKAMGAATRSGVAAADRLTDAAAARGDRRVLAPGAQPVRAAHPQDVCDYRGLARRDELGGLASGIVPLGRYLDVARGRPRDPLRLPFDTLVRHVAAIGPTGAGKTTGVIVPWIVSLLCAGVPVIAVDVKGDLLDLVRAQMQRELGRPAGLPCRYWNPAAARTDRWNPLAEIASERDVDAVTESILGRPTPGDPQPHFYQRDYRWLRALVHLVAATESPPTLPRLRTLATDQAALAAALARADRRHTHDLHDLTALSAEEHSRATAGLHNALHLLATGHTVAATATSDFTLDDVTHTAGLWIIGAHLADGRLGETASALALNLLRQRIHERYASHRRAPLALIVDEAPRLADRLEYEQLLAVARAADTGVCLAAQDLTQFGDDRTQTAILANCHTTLALPGCSPATAAHLSSRLGQRTTTEHTRSHDRAGRPASSTRAHTSVPVLRDREIMHPPVAQRAATIHVPSACPKPFLVDLTQQP